MERAGGGFFGRRKGKPLRPGRKAALEEQFPSLRIDLDRPAPRPLAELFPDPVDAVRLEIGFGGGEHLLHEAALAPRAGFIGVEPFQNGLAKAVTAIAARNIRNVRLYDDEAGPLLDWLPPGSLERIDLLYPDPWPKKRHWKRRFVNQTNLDRIARCLCPGGLFRFAGDIDSYVDWTLQAVHRHGGLLWRATAAADWREPFTGWPGTRYEAKALREGRRPAYLVFQKPG